MCVRNVGKILSMRWSRDKVSPMSRRTFESKLKWTPPTCKSNKVCSTLPFLEEYLNQSIQKLIKVLKTSVPTTATRISSKERNLEWRAYVPSTRTCNASNKKDQHNKANIMQSRQVHTIQRDGCKGITWPTTQHSTPISLLDPALMQVFLLRTTTTKPKWRCHGQIMS